MKKTVATIVGSGLLILGAVSLQPEKVITKEFSLDGEKVIVNPEPVQKEVLGGLITRKVFKPDVKLERFGGETFLRVWSDDEVLPNAIEQDGKIISKSIDGKREYHFYTKTKEELQNENGGFEYEIILKDKPATNTISLSIKTEGLDFYYQPPLTEEIKVGDRKGKIVKVTETDAYIKNEKTGELISISHRPENVVGSYAVYHESKSGDYSKIGGKNYKAGKAFHIYRPKIIDANGNWTWGKLNIDEKKGILTIEIDQNFLDKAVYPVKVDPTFGYTVAGGSTYNAFGDMVGSVFTGADGTAESITVYIHLDTADSTNKHKCAIYQHSDSSKVCETSEVDSKVDPADWSELSIPGGQSISAVDYVLVFASEEGWNYNHIYYDSGDTNQGHYQENINYPTFPDPASFSHNNNKYSIYCTYTEGGGTTEQPSHPNIIIFD